MSNSDAPGLSDHELAALVRQGGDETLTRLADALRGSLFAAAYAELRHYDDAQDAVANAFLRICRALPTLRQPERIRAWALQIVRREARRLRRPHSLSLDEGTVDTPPSESTLLMDVARILRALPGEQARATSLYYLDGLGVTEIARILERPEGTIKFWLHRGRAHLRVNLKGYEPMDTNHEPLVIVGSDLPTTLIGQMTDTCRNAGWDTVRHSIAPSPLRRTAEGRVELAPPFADCRCVVLDETVSGGISAFEWILLFRTKTHGKSVPVMLLLDANRPSGNSDDRPLAAYLAGFDMCLYRPFDLREFQSFVARLRTLPSAPEPTTVSQSEETVSAT